VRLRRADLIWGLGGASFGVAAAFAWDAGAVAAAAVIVLGAALATSRRYPAATWAFASVVLVVVAAFGSLPGNDAFAAYPLVAAHAFCAGRWDGRWGGVGGVVALAAAGVTDAALAHDAVVPFLFIPVTGWAAGRALREREQVAAELMRRARELEEEREAYAALSVRYERARIASELHDVVAHAISVMVIQASAGQRLAARDPEATAETFGVIAEAARQAEQDMGRLVALLGDRDAIGPAPDLSLLEELVSRAAGSGLQVTLRLEGEREGLPATLTEAAYHVVQEALTNALRYAAGAAVRVVVRGDRDALVVEVANGPTAGEPALAGVGAGTGLQGLRERVGACGGTLQAGPAPGGGWRVRARLPRRVAAASA
jgi:signal transduction histidine kinase